MRAHVDAVGAVVPGSRRVLASHDTLHNEGYGRIEAVELLSEPRHGVPGRRGVEQGLGILIPRAVLARLPGRRANSWRRRDVVCERQRRRQRAEVVPRVYLACVEIKFRAPRAIDAMSSPWSFQAIDATLAPWPRRLDGVEVHKGNLTHCLISARSRTNR